MRKAGFTMLELLAVLAIVLILGAILFPAIESAREKSLTTACSQNVRQIVLAITQYEQDKGQFPAGRMFINAGAAAPAVTDEIDWYNAIAPYMHADPNAVTSMGNVASVAAADELGGLPAGNQDRLYPDAYRCPSKSNWDRVGRNMSYGYNHQYLGDASPRSLLNPLGPTGFFNFPVRKSSIKRPGRMIAVADSDGTGWNTYQTAANEVTATNMAHAATQKYFEQLGAFGFLLDPTFFPARYTAGLGAIDPVVGTNISPAAGGLFVEGVGGTTVFANGAVANAADPSFRSAISNIHKGSANVAFLDGHVESIVREECYLRPAPDAATVSTNSRLYLSNELWNGFGLDNDINGNGAIDPTLGERVLDENEAFTIGNGNVLTPGMGGVYNPGPPANVGYGQITGFTSVELQAYGPGFDQTQIDTLAAGSRFMGTLPRKPPFVLSTAAAVQ